MCVIFSLISFFANEDLNENSNTSDFYEKIVSWVRSLLLVVHKMEECTFSQFQFLWDILNLFFKKHMGKNFHF